MTSIFNLLLVVSQSFWNYNVSKSQCQALSNTEEKKNHFSLIIDKRQKELFANTTFEQTAG